MRVIAPSHVVTFRTKPGQSITHTKDTTKARVGKNETRQHPKDTVISSRLAAAPMDQQPGRRQSFIQLKNWETFMSFFSKQFFHQAAFCPDLVQVVSTVQQQQCWSEITLTANTVAVSCWIHGLHQSRNNEAARWHCRVLFVGGEHS